jgi:hypothetical protein
MRSEAIFAPVCVLAFWTGLVILMTGVRRLWEIRAGRLSVQAFRLGESPEVPPRTVVVNRNLMNLLEMPVLFYMVCLSLYVTRHVEPRLVTLAWIYVGLRLVHSIIHLTYNRVLHRFLAFASSNVVLLVMWISFACRVVALR